MAIDIDQSFYNTGTASVENGGTVVTGQGTQWISSIRANDIFGTHKGDGVRILSVESNTSLTLAYPWTGETQAIAPYEVQFTPYDTGYYPAVRQLLQTMASGNVEAFAALTGAPNMVPIFTGPGAMDLIDPNTFGLQDPNGSLGNIASLTLDANKALTTDGSGNAQQINLGTLGRALLALASGTTAQYVQGDGTLQAKAGLPISTATQTALDGKASLSGATYSGSITVNSSNFNSIIAARPRAGASGAVQGGLLNLAYTDDTNFSSSIYMEGNPGNYTRLMFLVRFASTSAYFTMGQNGSMNIPGALSKGSGTFLIDHPLDPLNKNLRHGFVEAPEYLNIYRGVVDLENGKMLIDIDKAFGMSEGTFSALNAETCVFLQTQYGPERVWLEGPADSGKFTIISENPQSNASVAFMVTGRRKDAFVCSDLDPNTDSDGRFVPEFEKEDD